MPIPDYWDIKGQVEEAEGLEITPEWDPLQEFIFEQEPATPVAEKHFRDLLQAAITYIISLSKEEQKELL